MLPPPWIFEKIQTEENKEIHQILITQIQSI